MRTYKLDTNKLASIQRKMAQRDDVQSVTRAPEWRYHEDKDVPGEVRPFIVVDFQSATLRHMEKTDTMKERYAIVFEGVDHEGLPVAWQVPGFPTADFLRQLGLPSDALAVDKNPEQHADKIGTLAGRYAVIFEGFGPPVSAKKSTPPALFKVWGLSPTTDLKALHADIAAGIGEGEGDDNDATRDDLEQHAPAPAPRKRR